MSRVATGSISEQDANKIVERVHSFAVFARDLLPLFLRHRL